MACYTPIQIKSPLHDNAYIYVPCGKCSGCRKDKRDAWFIRFCEEEKVSKDVRFVTLTYDENNLPQSIDEDGVIHYNVQKSDLQKFFKRMRKTNKFKYFAVSEYGPESGRPHYHLLLFAKQSRLIDFSKYWTKGFVMDLPAEKGSFKYVTKYLLKGSNVPSGSAPNFMICSKKPAIGVNYLDLNQIEYLADGKMLYHHPGGVVSSLPSYYRKKILSSGLVNSELIKQLTIETMETQEKNANLKRIYFEKYGNLNGFEWHLEQKSLHDYKQQIKINKK